MSKTFLDQPAQLGWTVIGDTTIFRFERNNSDKVGRFVQGLVPAMIASEILIRKEAVNGRGWLNFLIVCFRLAFSALSELIESTGILLAGNGDIAK